MCIAPMTEQVIGAGKQKIEARIMDLQGFDSERTVNRWK